MASASTFRQIFGLLGPNGAGKSTLIRMLTTRPDQRRPDDPARFFAGLAAIGGDLLFLALFSVVAMTAATLLFKRTL